MRDNVVCTTAFAACMCLHFVCLCLYCFIVFLSSVFCVCLNNLKNKCKHTKAFQAQKTKKTHQRFQGFKVVKGRQRSSKVVCAVFKCKSVLHNANATLSVAVLQFELVGRLCARRMLLNRAAC